MKIKKLNKQSGFTLIEILVVIGIIAVLAAIVIIAINPAKQFAQARNSQRVANVNTVLNAIGQRIADNKGIFEGQFTVGGTTYYCPKLVTGGINTTAESSLADPIQSNGNLGCLIPTYVPSFPKDPKWVTGADTLYDIEISSAGRIKVCAPEMLLETAVPTLGAGENCVER